MTRTIDHVDVLRNSEKFRNWRPQEPPPDRTPADGLKTNMMAARHYKPEELADMWGVSTETIRSIFREEQGVLKIGKTGSKYRRGYVTLRIPEDVAERVHQRLSA